MKPSCPTWADVTHCANPVYQRSTGFCRTKKVARYYQVESKIDAIMEDEMAKRIPLVE